MPITIIILFFITSILIVAFLIYQNVRLSTKFEALSVKYEEVKNGYIIVQNNEQKYRDKCEEFEKDHKSLIEDKTEAETKNLNLSEINNKLENEIESLKAKIENITEDKNQIHRDKDNVQSKYDSILKQMQDWEKTKEEHIIAVKASALEASNNLSNKLLDDHRRETQNAKKENEKLVSQTTENLIKQHEGLIEKVGVLQKGVSKAEDVHRALLNPTGAGSLGEITLENIFKNSGLEKDVDYKMQYSTTGEEGKILRPDAVVFLPDDNVMVVDSKSSKFFVELESQSEDNSPAEINSKLKRMMNENLKDLVSRKYSEAIESEAGRKLARVYMFLPTEKALEKVRIADSGFMQKAWSQGVLPVAPTGLLNELLKSAMVITSVKQDENAKIIIEKVKELLNSVAILNNHGQKLGNNLKNAVASYDNFSASFNRNFLSKAKQIKNMGVDAKKLESVQPMIKIEDNKSNDIIDVQEFNIGDESNDDVSLSKKLEAI